MSERYRGSERYSGRERDEGKEEEFFFCALISFVLFFLNEYSAHRVAGGHSKVAMNLNVKWMRRKEKKN